MYVKSIWFVFKQTLTEWSADRVPRLAAALAYSTAFSIAPLLVIAVRIAAVVFGAQAARKQVSDQLQGLLGQSAADAVDSMLRKASASGSGGTFATVLGVAFFIYAAANLFSELQDSMNTIWDVELKPVAGWWPTLRRRLLSFGMVLGTGFLLVVSLVASAGLAAASRYVTGGGNTSARVVNLFASLVVFTLLIAMIFKLLPDVLVRWRDVWIGAGATAAFFTLGKYLIGMYLTRPSVMTVYCAVGSVAVLLIWVYYSAQVLFTGAEFTQVYAHFNGRQIRPAKDAVFLSEGDCPAHVDHDSQRRRATDDAGARPKTDRRIAKEAPPSIARPAVLVITLLVGVALGRRTRPSRKSRTAAG